MIISQDYFAIHILRLNSKSTALNKIRNDLFFRFFELFKLKSTASKEIPTHVLKK